MAEDTNLIAALDALESRKGPGPFTCQWWADASPELREATIRNVKLKGYTAVATLLKNSKQKITGPGIKDHAAGTCSKCQTVN